MSDMAGKAARVAVEPSGSERDTMERNGMGDIEGKVAREAMSECGQQASFKAFGVYALNSV
jgi:hypothetical protein